MFVVLSNRRPDRLEIETVDGDRNIVRLVVGALEASATVFNSPWRQTVVASLAKFFQDVDECWQGWPGTKDWSSGEGELRIGAVHDGLGTITLISRLRDASPENWSATGHLKLDAGAFRTLSQQFAAAESDSS